MKRLKITVLFISMEVNIICLWGRRVNLRMNYHVRVSLYIFGVPFRKITQRHQK